jgi:hypothetical protein
MRKPPSLRNNNGALQLRVRIDGTDAFINRLGSWSDPAATAKASALSARIWSDYCSGSFDKTLRTYQSTSDQKDKQLLEGLQHRALSNRQGSTIRAYRSLRSRYEELPSMRITKTEGRCNLDLSDEEASILVDACDLVVIASQSVPNVSLPNGMSTLPWDLFNGFRDPFTRHESDTPGDA